MTYNKANTFHSFQTNYSGIACPRMFLFQGAPDIILSAKKKVIPISGESDQSEDDTDDMIVDVVTEYQLESNSDSCEEDKVIECARGPIPTTQVNLLPEKAGQLIAELHFIAVAAIVRNLVKGRHLVKFVKVKGIIIDKVNGIFRCELTVTVATADKPVGLEVSCIDSNGC